MFLTQTSPLCGDSVLNWNFAFWLTLTKGFGCERHGTCRGSQKTVLWSQLSPLTFYVGPRNWTEVRAWQAPLPVEPSCLLESFVTAWSSKRINDKGLFCWNLYRSDLWRALKALLFSLPAVGSHAFGISLCTKDWRNSFVSHLKLLEEFLALL